MHRVVEGPQFAASGMQEKQFCVASTLCLRHVRRQLALGWGGGGGQVSGWGVPNANSSTVPTPVPSSVSPVTQARTDIPGCDHG